MGASERKRNLIVHRIVGVAVHASQQAEPDKPGDVRGIPGELVSRVTGVLMLLRHGGEAARETLRTGRGCAASRSGLASRRWRSGGGCCPLPKLRAGGGWRQAASFTGRADAVHQHVMYARTNFAATWGTIAFPSALNRATRPGTP